MKQVAVKVFAHAHLALALTAAANAQLVSTNLNWTTGYFNQGDGYEQLASLDGQATNAPVAEQWQTTDPYTTGPLGSTSVLNYYLGLTFSTNTAGNMTVAFGGYDLNGGVLPGITNPVLYRDFTPFVGGPATTNISTVWSVDFDIANYNNVFYPQQDTFGFDLQDSLGNSLAQFLFNPATATSQDLRFEWYRNGTLQTTNNFEIGYDTLYRLTATLYDSSFDLSISGLVTQTNGSGVVTGYTVVTNVSLITAGSLSGILTRADFATAAMNWNLASGNINDPGSQALLVNTMSVYDVYTVIPETGTWLGGVALLAITGLVAWRRRASSTSACS